LGIVTEADDVLKAIDENEDYIRGETLAVELQTQPLPDVAPADCTVSGKGVQLHVAIVDDA
jgi:hypothetical protein